MQPGSESREPSQSDPDQDLKYYYYGLRGTPRLLAQTSSKPFQTKWSNGFCVCKTVFLIRRHRIIDIYDKELRDNIRAVVEPYRWLAIDIVRIGYSSKA